VIKGCRYSLLRAVAVNATPMLPFTLEHKVNMILQRNAARCINYCSISVCLSFCPSDSSIVSKRMNVG